MSFNDLGTNHLVSRGQPAIMRMGDYLTGDNKDCFLIFDGNLVLYRGSGPGDNKGPIWGVGLNLPAGNYCAALHGNGEVAVHHLNADNNVGDKVCTILNPIEPISLHSSIAWSLWVQSDTQKIVLYQNDQPAPEWAFWTSETGDLVPGLWHVDAHFRDSMGGTTKFSGRGHTRAAALANARNACFMSVALDDRFCMSTPANESYRRVLP